jgi:hypothetical protein
MAVSSTCTVLLIEFVRPGHEHDELDKPPVEVARLLQSRTNRTRTLGVLAVKGVGESRYTAIGPQQRPLAPQPVRDRLTQLAIIARYRSLPPERDAEYPVHLTTGQWHMIDGVVDNEVKK